MLLTGSSQCIVSTRGGINLNKSLQTAKIEELLKVYKNYKEIITDKDERFWIKTIIKDLKWLLDDETY